MSKMIYREPNGNWGVKGVPWAEIPDGLYGALYKLMDYEDICSSPSVLQCYMDDDLGPVRYRLIDEGAQRMAVRELQPHRAVRGQWPNLERLDCMPVLRTHDRGRHGGRAGRGG